MLNMNISIPVKISYVGSPILLCQVKELTYQGEDVMNGFDLNESYGGLWWLRCYLISWFYHSNCQLVSFDLLCFFLVICWLMIFVRLRWFTQCLWCKKDIWYLISLYIIHDAITSADGFIMFIYDTFIVQSWTSCTHRSLYRNWLFWVQHSNLRWCYMHLCCSMLV